jgi:predicted PurR-regulated permease PerM
MAAPRPSYQGLITRAVATLAAAVALFWLLYTVRSALLIIYISGLLALGFTPTIRSLERKRWFGAGRVPRWAAILVVYLVIVGVIVITIAVVVPPLVSQIMQLREDLPGYLARAEAFLIQRGIIDSEWTLDDAMERLPSAGQAVPVVLVALQGVIGTLGTIVAILVLPYYLLIEAGSIQSGFLRMFPKDTRPALAHVTREVTFKVGAWLNGQMIIGVIVGSVTTIVLWLMGVPYFYVLGLLAGLSEFIPILGPIIFAVPAILIGFTQSVAMGFGVIAYFAALQFVDGNILVPRIMERQVGVSSWSVIVALLIGSEWLGLVGALLAVPSAAIAQVFFQEYFGRDDEKT